MRRLKERLRRDDGFTLIELVIYSALLLLVLGIVGSVMVSGITNQARITDTTSSTTESQTAVESLGLGVRNATAINSPTVSRPLLIVKTYKRGATADLQCQAWYYSATERTIRAKVTNNTKIGIPSASQLRTWTLLAENVAPVDSSTPIFQTSGRTVTVNFVVRSDAGSGQIVTTSIASRQNTVGGAPSECVL
ncbi:prepilin-type N-terminal cleavage/methylation domain-containing protein [Herbiconiux sp. L3-i23]|uniref:prepilin-type N-terminal cleavage/methylation domain-containing protein n=1 Tax=Herbiconiux sp. L3-i23 TaxID=2905871 RepID=UPI00204BB16B|nr:prepilin-type N-terminal cleavage/methylation domain-containing protein [Herbiconiux sp. L3-i23]BDI23915.1 hypothetical protein L3i23_26910 [Herbiconiux sp. L3-i23]